MARRVQWDASDGHFYLPWLEAHPIYRMPVLLSGGDTDLILLIPSGDNHEVIVRERMTGIAL